MITIAVSIAILAGQTQAKRIDFPITLSDGQRYTMVGYLYERGATDTLQVVVHGGNYNHTYWDIPNIDGNDYSYAAYMTRRRHAVLALDLLGAGASSKPNADTLTLAEQGLALHQVLREAKHGRLLRSSYRHIVLVGHSMGSHTAVYTQGAYGDADALVTTGAVHVLTPPAIDPALVGQLAAQYPYFKLPPEVRASVFYNPADADDSVITYDLARLDDVIPRGYALSIVPFIAEPSVTLVDRVFGPVLVQLGEFDPVAPAAVAQAEKGVWSQRADVTVQVIPDVGHSVNGHYGNTWAWRAAYDWIENELRKNCRR